MRPFCIATIGAILGIILGLYLQSIAFFVLLFLIQILVLIVTYIINKKIIKNILIFLICLSLFYTYVFSLENKYNELNRLYNKQELQFKAIVVSNKTKKEYKDVYQIKVIEIEKNKLNFKMLLNVKREKASNLDLKYGDKISITAVYETPSGARNEGGFDYRQYLKTKGITGVITTKASTIKVIDNNKGSLINEILFNIKNTAISKVKSIILSKDCANLCTSLLLGEKSELSETIQEDFRNSNLSHMLAISGAHVSYILLELSTIIQKSRINKRWSNLIIIIFLIFFMALVGFTPSVTRACIMTILQLFANIVFKKSDTYQNLAISSFIILAFNPYSILDIGFQLSFGGTIGIVLFSKNLLAVFDSFNVEISKYSKIILKTINSIKEMSIVTISANLLIIPIMMYHFNTISFTFLISNLLAAPILGIAIILSMIFLLLVFICYPAAKLMSFILQPILQLLILIANFSSKLPFSKVLVPTPKVWQIILYYLILSIIFFVKSDRLKEIKEKKKIKANETTVKNPLNQDFKITKHILDNEQPIKRFNLLKYKRSIISLSILFIILPYIFQIFPSNKLIINFIDVGQGDSMLIQTPSHKTILVDGGGSEAETFDVGEKTLLPYLLDKGIMNIDYMMFSHFDTDHCGRFIYNYGKIKCKKCDYI